MASLQIHQSTISSVAERIVRARQLYGPDSSYVIGMFQGLDLLLADTDASAARQQIQDQVVKLEGNSSKGSRPTAPASPAAGAEGKRASTTPQADTPGGEALAENTWVRGAVKWFNNDKGYGFISTAADADVFVHWRDISSWDRSLTQGDEVEFMVTKTAKGFQAINVMKPGSGGEGKEAGTEDSATAPAAPEDGKDTPGNPVEPSQESASAEAPATAEVPQAAATTPTQVGPSPVDAPAAADDTPPPAGEGAAPAPPETPDA